MENKTMLLLTVILIASMLVFGCIGTSVEGNGVIKKNETNMSNGGDANGTNATIPARCEDMTTGRENCLIQRAYNNNYIYDCYLLDGEYFEQCIAKISELNYTYCTKLSNSTGIDGCLMNVVGQFGDDACDMITNETLKTSCLLRDYTETCRNITDPYMRTVCNAVAKADASFCSDLDNSTQMNDCYLNYSITRNENACGNITNLGKKTACEDMVLNQTTCGTLTNTQIQANCYLYYATYKRECSWCDPIGDITYKNDCYEKCAIATTTMSVCSRASTELERDNCYWDYAKSTGDVNACEKIKINSFEKTCVQQIALANAKPAECDVMKNTSGITQTDVSACYLAVITGAQVSFDNCVAMEDAYLEDTCIYNAIKRDGISTDYCAYIRDNALRAECLKLF